MAKKKKIIDLDVPQASDTPVVAQSTQKAEEPQMPTPTTTPVSTAENTEPTEETTTSPLTPIYDRVVAKQAEAQAAQERADALVKAFKRADGEGRAMLLNIMKEAEPKKDVDKEKRLRTLAKVQAWGDMLGALTSGVVANTGRYGKGYIPYLPSGSALSSIDEINKMQDEYAKRKLAWDDNMINFRLGNEQAKIEAAKALATKAQSTADAKVKEAEDAYADALETTDRWNRLQAEEQGRAERTAAEVASRERVAQINAKAKENKPLDFEDEQAILLAAYDVISPWEPTEYEDVRETYDEYGIPSISIGKKQTTYNQDKPARQAEARKNEYARMVVRGMKELGLTFDESLRKVLAYIEKSKAE